MEKIPCESKVEKVGPCETKIELLIPQVYIDGRFEKELASKAKTAKIPGFREGKASKDVVKRYFGADVEQKTVSQVIGDAVHQVLLEKDIKAVSTPRLTDSKPVDGGLVSFTLNVDMFPEVEVKKYKGLKLTKVESEVTASDIEKEIEGLRDYTAKLLPVEEDRAVSGDDFAVIDYNLAVEGIDLADKESATDVMVGIGKKQFIEGFEDGLKGMKKGDKKTLELTFPKDYHDVKVAGQKAVFHVTLKEIKQKDFHKTDDELAKAIGLENGEAMRAKIEEGMKANKARKAKEELYGEVRRVLVEHNPVDVPHSMMHERAHYLQDLAATNLMRNQGFTEAMAKEQVAKWHDEFHKRAEEELKAEFVIDKVATDEKIDATDADVEVKFAEMAVETRQPVDKIKAYYNAERRRIEYLKIAIREEKAIQFIIDNAKLA